MNILLYILFIFLFLKILNRIISKLKVSFLKKEIKKNPFIGIKDLDDTYLFKKEGYILRYRIVDLPSGDKEIKLISYKCRLTGFEEFIYKIKRFIGRAVLYPRLKTSVIISLFLIIVILYIWILIPQTVKINFYRWSAARMIGVSPEQVEYKEAGWFEIYGKRIIPEDKRTEPLTFTINPLRWLFFSDYGYVTRWRGKEYGGYKTHDLRLDEERKISIKETGRPAHGKFEGDKIKWDVSKGKGLPLTQDIEIKEEGIRIIDR